MIFYCTRLPKVWELSESYSGRETPGTIQIWKVPTPKPCVVLKLFFKNITGVLFWSHLYSTFQFQNKKDIPALSGYWLLVRTQYIVLLTSYLSIAFSPVTKKFNQKISLEIATFIPLWSLVIVLVICVCWPKDRR